jgi:N-acyl-D-amino-acid deacylase
MDLLIKNAEVFDGINEQGRKTCVIVRDNKIAAVGATDGWTGEVLDAEGLSLAPGFIDTHSHNDFYTVLADTQKYIRPFVEQGITTMVGGNCGFSMVGIEAETPHSKDLFAFFIANPDYKNVATFTGWAEAVNTYSPVNMACLCGHGTIRTSLRGLASGALSADEQKRMERRVEEELEAGAAGVSFGLMYEPGMYAPEEELLALAKIAARRGKIITFHQRALSRFSTSYPQMFGRAHNLRALDEVIRIAEDSGAKTQVSHLIFVGRSTWNTVEETLSIIDKANARGLDIAFDIYPYDFGASTITVVLPAWYQALPLKQKNKALTRLRLGVEIFITKKLLGFGFDDIRVTWAGEDCPRYTGKRIGEIAREDGMSDLSAYLKIVEESKGEATVIMYSYQNDAIIARLSRHPKVSYMTDAWIAGKGMENPASFGAFPKFLRLSREGAAESLGAMIRKMTGQAARRFDLKDRGRIEEGCYADLVLFDRERIAEKDDGSPEGIPHVIINGEFAVRDGIYLGKALGRALG